MTWNKGYIKGTRSSVMWELVEKSREAIAPASGGGLEGTLLTEDVIWKKSWTCRKNP